MSRLNSLIKQSNNVKLHHNADSEFWFSLGNQKRYMFLTASELMIAHNMSAKDALDKAEELVDIFYKDHVQKSTRKDP